MCLQVQLMLEAVGERMKFEGLGKLAAEGRRTVGGRMKLEGPGKLAVENCRRRMKFEA